jgi:hypothetical protein
MTLIIYCGRVKNAALIWYLSSNALFTGNRRIEKIELDQPCPLVYSIRLSENSCQDVLRQYSPANISHLEQPP